MNKVDLQAFTVNMLADHFLEQVHLELQLLPFGDASSSRNGFNMKIDGQYAGSGYLLAPSCGCLLGFCLDSLQG